MNLCYECHIVYEEKYCPLCEAKADIENLQKEIETLNQQIEDLSNTPTQ